MAPFSNQPNNDSGAGSGFGRRHRRNTADTPSAGKEGKRWSFAASFTNGRKSSNADMSAFPGNLPPFIDELQQLQKYILKIRREAKNINNVDSAWNCYEKNKDKCFQYCDTLITLTLPRRDSSAVSPTTIKSPRPESRKRESSFDAISLAPIDRISTQSSGSQTGTSLRLHSQSEQYWKAARDWEATVELLAKRLVESLQETYNKYGEQASDEGFARICTDKGARINTIEQMREKSLSQTMSADLGYFPLYRVRFSNYDRIQEDLVKVRSLLSTAGIPENRTIIEHYISPTGDVILEFGNAASEENPVHRFRVSSHCLKETSSPIFRHMFNAQPRAELDDEIQRNLPLAPTPHHCQEDLVMLYRMPQTELNIDGSLEILLHAAHNHNDNVPRKIQFNLFVAITEVCLRYQCTSPLELYVEHEWLPYWRENATDDMLADALLISYVFGLSKNFTRLSRLAILNMGNPSDASCKPWPPRVERMITTVYRSKMEQIYDTCRTTLNEYLYPRPYPDSNSSIRVRCPRKDRACDAQNVGWFMKYMADLGLLPTVLQSAAPTYPPRPQTQMHAHAQSLQQVIDALSLITSPPGCHGGICDFAPAFRSAINDVYESLKGLTLFEVSGKHGWALSKNGAEPSSSSSSSRRGFSGNDNSGSGNGAEEELFKIATAAGQMKYAPACQNQHLLSSLRPNRLHRGSSGGAISWPRSGEGDEYSDDDNYHDEDEDEEFHDEDDACYFKILSFLDDPRDLRAAALVNRRFYRSYRRNEARLWAGMPGRGKGIWNGNGNGNGKAKNNNHNNYYYSHNNNNNNNSSSGSGSGSGSSNNININNNNIYELNGNEPSSNNSRRRRGRRVLEEDEEHEGSDAVPRWEKRLVDPLWIPENKQLVEPEMKAHASLRHRLLLLGRGTSASAGKEGASGGGAGSGRRFNAVR